jgi:hypothetical protein
MPRNYQHQAGTVVVLSTNDSFANSKLLLITWFNSRSISNHPFLPQIKVTRYQQYLISYLYLFAPIN